MHPVIQNVLNRKNKKVPIDDGRKIALVVYGGTMTGIRAAGALTSLNQLGLSGCFDSIYSFSAGFFDSCYFLTNQLRPGLKIYTDYIPKSHFIEPKRFWRIVDVDYLIDVIKNKVPLDIEKIYKSKTKLYVAMKNKNKKEIEYLDLQTFPKEKFFDIAKAAIKIPFLSPGSVNLMGENFKDYPTGTNNGIRLLEHVYETDHTDILVVYCRRMQFKLPSLFSEKIYEIIPDDNPAMRRLEINQKILKDQFNLSRKQVKSIFDII